ncbi:10158_t:CDS:1, partial [Paraglomus brasilianum]
TSNSISFEDMDNNKQKFSMLIISLEQMIQQSQFDIIEKALYGWFFMVHWQQYSCYKAQEYYQQIINAGVDLPAKFEVANGWLKRFQEWFEKQYQEKVHQSIYQ